MADQVITNVGQLPGFQLASTNLFNFGPELDAIASNVQSILANQTTFINTLETEQQNLAAQLNAKIATLTQQMEQLAVLFQAAIIGIAQAATLANQEAALAQQQQIYNLLAPLRPVSVGLDPAETSTVPQLAPDKRGP